MSYNMIIEINKFTKYYILEVSRNILRVREKLHFVISCLHEHIPA